MADHTVSIRDFDDHDRSAVAALQIENWISTYGHLAKAGFIDGPLQDSTNEEWKMAHFDGDDFALVATTSDDSVIGFITVLRRESYAFIDHLHVSPAHRRLGVGRKLMLAASSRILMQSYSIMRLTVYAENQRARTFYAALGGVEIEEYEDDTLGTTQQTWVVEWNGNIPTG